MIRRSTLVAALLALELVIVREAVIAVTSTGSVAREGTAPRIDALLASGPNLVEDGPHRIFDVGVHPAITVDIGYADLTIATGTARQIDVSVSSSTSYGMMRETAPFIARADGDTIHIARVSEKGWSVGDDRMITVTVPADTRVTVTHAGDIRADGLRATGSFHSVGRGWVTIDDYQAPELLASAGGHITLHNVVTDRLEATSDDSRVEASSLQVKDGTIESDERISLGFSPGTDTEVVATADDGKINLTGFPDSASSGAGRNADGDSDSAARTLRVGTGAGHLDVHSSDGDITLVQEGEAR